MCVFFTPPWWQSMKRPRVDFLPSSEHQEDPELWDQQRPLHLSSSLGSADEFEKVSPGSQISLLIVILSFMWQWCNLPAPSQLERCWGWGVKYPGHIQSWSRDWVGLNWKILRNSPPGERYWVGGCLKDAREYPPNRKVWGGWAVELNWKPGGISRAWLKDAAVPPLLGTEWSSLSG